MFHYHFPTKNNKHDHSTESYEDYIDTDKNLPDINPYIDTSAEIETELLYGVRGMRREFRKTAKRLRKHYSDKESEAQYMKLLSRHASLQKRRAIA